MSTPLISVLVPVYNVEKYLEECIESIINQKYENLEIILVDDGSTDNSGAICDKYAEKDGRIKVIHQKNQGLATVRNVSVAAATGDYAGFVDSDDFISPDMYGDMVTVAEKNASDMVVCNISYVDGNGNKIPNYRSAKAVTNTSCTGTEYITELCDQYSSTYVVAWNKLYKRSLLDGIRYPDGKINEDEAVIHRIAHKCDKISFTEKAHYYYRQQSESIMNRPFTLKNLDGLYALLDRTDFLKEYGYDINTIRKSGLYLIHNCTESFKKLDTKNAQHRQEIKKIQKLIKPICKDLLKCSLPTKKEKFVISLLKANPFLYLKIFKRKRK